MPEEIPNNSAQTTNPQDQANISPTAQTPPNDSPSQKPAKLNFKNFIIIGAVVVVAIIMFITGYFLFLPQQNEAPNISVNNINPTTVPAETSIPIPENALEAPKLYPEFDWEKFIENEINKSLGRSALYSQKGDWGSIRMNGEEWTASKDNLDRDSMEVLLTGFDEYYNLELTQRGWSNIYEDEQYNLSPLAADGPGGSIWGYIKVNNGKLRVILLQKLTPLEDFGGLATCPCNIGFRVFISDIESIEELVKRID